MTDEDRSTYTIQICLIFCFPLRGVMGDGGGQQDIKLDAPESSPLVAKKLLHGLAYFPFFQEQGQGQGYGLGCKNRVLDVLWTIGNIFSPIGWFRRLKKDVKFALDS